MKQINKMKVLVVTLLMIGLVMSLFILVNDQVNQSNNQLIAANKVKTNQNKSANSVVKDELLTLVNFENTIPKDWKVDLVQLNNGQSVDRRIYDDLIAMLQAAKSEGLNPLICSSLSSGYSSSNAGAMVKHIPIACKRSTLSTWQTCRRQLNQTFFKVFLLRICVALDSAFLRLSKSANRLPLSVSFFVKIV